MKKAKMIWAKILAFSILLLCITAGLAAGAEPGSIVSADMEGEQAVLYVWWPQAPEDIQCQVGTVPCPQVSYGPVQDQEVSARTLFLIDNSLSVLQKYRPVINEILNNLAAGRMPNELVTVATFSDRITYLLEDSNDSALIKQAIDNIQYQDQETYLTDVLYEVLAAWNQDEDSALKRVVIVSDGVDNKAIGYTKEELYELLRSRPYPIYTIGCSSQSKGNSEELKNMFALSRMVQTSSWLLDDVSDPMEIAAAVAADNQIWKVAVPLPPEVCDGSSKGIKLSVTSGGQVYEGSLTMDMPFGSAVPAESETQETETETEPETETETEPETEEEEETEAPEPEDAGKKKIIMYIIFGCCGALVLGVIVVVVVRVVKKNNQDIDFVTAPENAYQDVSANQGFSGVAAYQGPVSGAGLGSGFGRQEGNTAMVWGDPGRTYMLVLTDLNNPARSFEAPLRTSVVIGRSRSGGCQIVLDYDRSVSHKHCQIRMINGQMRVMDLGSRNGTILNGKRVIQEAVLSSGSILTLGNLRMKVELR